MDIDNNAPSKLLPGEMVGFTIRIGIVIHLEFKLKCHICHEKPARGIKYNAISCDSCRVFFRRIVLIKDQDPSRESLHKCTSTRIKNRELWFYKICHFELGSRTYSEPC